MSERILLVDDTPTNIQYVGSLLKDRGYRIHVADSGPSGLEAATEIRPDIILLDIMMPEMDGFEVCRRLKTQPSTRSIPVIFLTARTDSDAVVQGFQLGAVDYVTKPFVADEVVARVNTHLSLRRTFLHQRSLLHILSDDLRAPLERVASLVDNAETDRIESAERDAPQISAKSGDTLAEIRSAANSCLNLIEMAQALYEADDPRLTLLPVNLSDALKDALEQLSAKVSSKEIRVIHEIPENLVVRADRSSLVACVFRNLIAASVAYGSSHSTLRIGSIEVEQEILITLESEGPGIPTNLLDEFRELDTSPGESDERHDLGIGLLVARRFAEAYGGMLEMDPGGEEGAGTRMIRLWMTLASTQEGPDTE